MRAANSRAANFAPIDKLKEKATAAAMKKQYNVQDYYKVPQMGLSTCCAWLTEPRVERPVETEDEGCAQKIARHPWFDNLTIMVVMANSIWLGVDADLNQEPILFNAHPVIIGGAAAS